MSDQPTPTPPWERPWERTVSEYCENTSMLERSVRIAHDKGTPKLAEFAWSELCALRTRLAALERVAKAADIYFRKPGVGETTDLMNAIDAVKST